MNDIESQPPKAVNNKDYVDYLDSLDELPRFHKLKNSLEENANKYIVHSASQLTGHVHVIDTFSDNSISPRVSFIAGDDRNVQSLREYAHRFLPVSDLTARYILLGILRDYFYY